MSTFSFSAQHAFCFDDPEQEQAAHYDQTGRDYKRRQGDNFKRAAEYGNFAQCQDGKTSYKQLPAFAQLPASHQGQDFNCRR